MGVSTEQRELNTGIVIAGAYADKVRRTLFAQLGEIARRDREFAKEVARASAELNVVLYNILVEQLKVDKGDAVRIRINYTVDPSKKIRWHYDTLKLEVFRRVPDDQVTLTTSRVIRESLSQILESFRLAPAAAEEAVRAFGALEEEVEKRLPTPPAPAQPAVAPVESKVIEITSLVGSVDLIGETVDGGYLLKLTGKDKSSMGLVSVTPVEEGSSIDAVIIHQDKCYRIITRSKNRASVYADTPERVLEDMSGARPVEISKDIAMNLIKEKMQMLV